MKYRLQFVLITVFINLLISSCATLINGRTQAIAITAKQDNVLVSIDGKKPIKTPEKIELVRKEDHVLVFKKQGHLDQIVSVKKVANPAAFAAVALPGGSISLLIDLKSGANFSLKPEKIVVNFTETKGTRLVRNFLKILKRMNERVLERGFLLVIHNPIIRYQK